MKLLAGLSFLENLPFYDVLESFIKETINLDGYIQQAFDFVNSLDVVTLLLGIVVAGIIFIMGTFELIKKLSKIIIVVAILVGLYLLYSNGALDSIIGG